LEISCPAAINVLDKEEEKMAKYQPLARQMRLLYKQTVDIIPVVFGVTGVASEVLLKEDTIIFRETVYFSTTGHNSGSDIHIDL